MMEYGTGGFRGVIMDDFTKENIKLIAQGLAEMIKQDHSAKPVYIGYDYRFGSEQAAIYMADTLAANHIQVYLSDQPTPSPTVQHACVALDTDYGIMITASHNPYYYNGIKLYQPHGVDAEKEMTDRLKEILMNKIEIYESMDYQYALKEGKIKIVNILDPYIDNILKFVKNNIPKRQLKILLDPIYGTGSITLRPTLERMRFTNITEIHNSHDVLFGGYLPNPTKENMLEDKERVLKEHFDICIGTDSDCDRIGILDENGEYVDANEIMASIYYYLIQYRGMKGDVIKNITTSNLIDEVAKYLHQQCHIVDVGFKNIYQGMKEHNALLGGESSGGLTIQGYLPGKDSTFATSIFLEMLSEIDKPVSQIIKEIRDLVSFYKRYYETSLSFHNRKRIMEAANLQLPLFPYDILKKETLNNNVKYHFANGDWALVRFSGTENLIRVVVESDNQDKANKYIKALEDFIHKYDSNHKSS